MEHGGFGRFAWRATLAHVSTYVVFGLLASSILDYETHWQSEWMDHYRPMDSPMVALGMPLQILRGLLFAVALYPFRSVFLERPRGWLPLWVLLVGVGILSTYAAAPGSVEGMIYTQLPWQHHVFGIPEVYGQALAFSLCLVGWYTRPHPAWGIVLGALTLLASLAGLAAGVLAPLAESAGA